MRNLTKFLDVTVSGCTVAGASVLAAVVGQEKHRRRTSPQSCRSCLLLGEHVFVAGVFGVAYFWVSVRREPQLPFCHCKHRRQTRSWIVSFGPDPLRRPCVKRSTAGAYRASLPLPPLPRASASRRPITSQGWRAINGPMSLGPPWRIPARRTTLVTRMSSVSGQVLAQEDHGHLERLEPPEACHTERDTVPLCHCCTNQETTVFSL